MKGLLIKDCLLLKKHPKSLPFYDFIGMLLFSCDAG